MSQRIRIPALLDPAPVGRGRRGDRMPVRVRSLGSVNSSQLDRSLRRSLKSQSSSVTDSSFDRKLNPFRSYPKSKSSSSEFAPENAYENFFIGSSKQPKIQNKIYSDEEINAVQEKESKDKKTKELVDIIKEALGTKKKPRVTKPKVEERLLPSVLYLRTNSSPPKEIWKVSDINAYRMKK